MTYLYGDSTEAGLDSNFLELLRDALDFSVFVLQSDEKIRGGKTKGSAASEAAAGEISRIERFTGVVSAAIDGAEKGSDDSPTANCAKRLNELLQGATRQAVDGVRAKLAADMSTIDAEESAIRGACQDALGSFLSGHADATASRRLALLENNRYDASLTGTTRFDIAWTFALAIPEGNLWASPVRMERLVPELQISTPQVTGWLSKEVKVRPQRLDKHTVTELTIVGRKTSFKLRIEAAAETGFDVTCEEGRVKMTRIGPSDDAAAGAFDVEAADLPVLVELCDKLTAAAQQLTVGKLESATIGEEHGEFRASPTFTPIVERMIATLAPTVREIARRSLTPTELVLRRSLADNRREEVFVTKATLREKYSNLSAPLRALFMPLGVDGPAPTPAPAPVAAQAQAAQATPPPRAEIRRSQPPAPLPPVSTPPRPKPSVPPPAVAPAAGDGKNEAFVDAVKKIVLVLQSGRTDEGYGQYADLLSSTSFAAYPPDDQRQALKLLLMAKAPPSRSDAVLRAYKVALSRIQSLVDSLADPADYEMLGVAHLQLEDKAKASAAFDTALKLERARNPASELSMNLARRLSQIN